MLAAFAPLCVGIAQAELAALEEAFRTFDLYVWLAHRMARPVSHPSLLTAAPPS